MSENSKDGKKKGSSKAVGLAIGAVVLTSIFGVSVPLVILIGAGAFGIGKLVGIMSQPLDLTTHNRQDRQKQEVEDLRMSGDAEADPVITKGQEMLREIRAANDAIPDPGLSRQMDQLEELCVQIFRTVSEKPSKAPQIRKFMNYYLPTTLKMLNSYRTMQDRGVSSQNLSEARRTLSRGMDMILTACQKQLDNLYKDTILDVSTDIDVLEQMLKRDGFTDSAFEDSNVSETARTAAAAQMGASSVPTIHTPDMDEEEDFHSYYSSKKQK